MKTTSSSLRNIIILILIIPCLSVHEMAQPRLCTATPYREKKEKSGDMIVIVDRFDRDNPPNFYEEAQRFMLSPEEYDQLEKTFYDQVIEPGRFAWRIRTNIVDGQQWHSSKYATQTEYEQFCHIIQDILQQREAKRFAKEAQRRQAWQENTLPRSQRRHSSVSFTSEQEEFEIGPVHDPQTSASAAVAKEEPEQDPGCFGCWRRWLNKKK